MNKKYFDNIVKMVNNETELYKKSTECLYAAYYEGKWRYEKLFGGDETSVAYKRDAFEYWIKSNKHRKITLIHNHPLEESENVVDICFPSEEDQSFTKAMIAYQYMYGFNLAEHLIIVGENPNLYYAIIQDKLLKVD